MLSYDVVEWGRPLRLLERETPKPTGTEVLLRLKYCGVCHSDAHIRDGYFDLGGGKRLPMSERGMSLPATLGHEPFGTVIAAGPDANNFQLGCDRLVYPWTGCGDCVRCREGLDNYCMAPRMIGIQRPGGYADHLIVPHPRYLIDASDIDPVWAATLSCSGLSTYSAVSKVQPIPRDEWVAVMGAGGLGLSAIGMLRALGHERMVAVDIDDAKLTAANAVGAAATANSRDGDARQKLQQITGGALYGVVDFVGSTDTAQLGLASLRKGGKLILVGLFGGEIPLSVGSTILRALTIQGSHLGSVAELKSVVALAREGKLKPIPIETRPISEVSRTLDELKAGTIVGRVVAEIDPEVYGRKVTL
ncbi:MAG: alcohol dehydrogenase catalytic domain-containing protein [Deltaproteobacteria bacterium]|nr:alcohol dehydrogenase catalytic domain-containing protein [Deltaproteobacteria bacterium]